MSKAFEVKRGDILAESPSLFDKNTKQYLIPGSILKIMFPLVGDAAKTDNPKPFWVHESNLSIEEN